MADYSSMTVADLKAECKTRGLPVAVRTPSLGAAKCDTKRGKRSNGKDSQFSLLVHCLTF